MGVIIAAKSPTEDILRDVQISLKLCREAGGTWATEANALLPDALRRATDAGQVLTRSDNDLSSARHQLNQASNNARLRIGAFYDELWNTLGRVRYDQQLNALFPGGLSKWQSGTTETQIVRIETLGNQLATVDHPVLSSARCLAMAVEVLALGEALKTAFVAVVRNRSHRAEASQIYQALGRAAHVQLSLLKKILLGRRFRQDQIHAFIPDRSLPVRTVPTPSETTSEVEPEVQAETEITPEASEEELPEEPTVEPLPEPTPAPRQPLSVVPPSDETVTTTTVTTTTKAA